jgi:hypothetical protein
MSKASKAEEAAMAKLGLSPPAVASKIKTPKPKIPKNAKDAKKDVDKRPLSPKSAALLGYSPEKANTKQNPASSSNDNSQVGFVTLLACHESCALSAR